MTDHVATLIGQFALVVFALAIGAKIARALRRQGYTQALDHVEEDLRHAPFHVREWVVTTTVRLRYGTKEERRL